MDFRIANTVTDKSGRIVVKAIDHLGDEVMKVFKG